MAEHRRTYSRYVLEGMGLFGKSIRLGRMQRRLTAQELAERIGVSRSTLQHHSLGGAAMTSKNRLTVNLSDEEAMALDELSEKSKVSKAWLGRHAICSLLERTQGDHNQLPLPLTELARKGVR